MSFYVCIGQLMDGVCSAVVFTDASPPLAYPSNKSLVCCFVSNWKWNFHLTLIKKKKGKQIHANNYARSFCWLYCSIPGVTATSALKDGLMKGFLLAKMALLSIISVLFCEKWNSAFCTCALFWFCVTDCGTNGLFALRAAVCPYGTWEMSNHHTGCNQLKCRCKFNEKLWEELLPYTD